ncbi:hypothetical protein Salat_2130900 [Sesamum alatum]|uniref:Uncharacterized protein n=1 Tax=Sesamum alatum TaxID=300844 RepID=A0AAE2CGY7_9LAMI|nr:hypothetical protein Salat_2130900 [Sesamum alatum]
MKLGVGSHPGLGNYATNSRRVYSIDRPREPFPTRSIATAVDLMSRNHLRARRRHSCQILTGDRFYLGIHRPHYILQLPWTRLIMTISKTWSPLAKSKIQPSYASDCHDSSSPRTNPVLSEPRISVIPTKPPRLPYDDSRESVQSVDYFAN